MIGGNIELSGPLFRANVGKVIDANVGDFLDQVAKYGETRVKGMIATREPSMKHPTGWTRNHVVGRTRAELARGGKGWRRNVVISASTDGMGTKDAKRTKAAASTIEARWHPFRSTTFAIRALIRKLNMTKGLE